MVVRGAVERIADVGVIERFTGWVNAKYETDIAVSFFTDNATFRLAPEWVFSLDEGDFTGTPTRWTFPGNRPAKSCFSHSLGPGKILWIAWTADARLS